MRTLKKVLALTMVMALALSFMANAAFKDENDMNVDLIEDINLVSALGVMRGDGDSEGNPTNNFMPTRVLKRGEAAKILYVLLTGSESIDEASWTSLANRTFTDTKGHWSDAYVNFVAKENAIIQGTSATTFEPEATLTGTQFAKMLLCLVGYSSDKEGYTGSDWAANVLRDGQKASLFEDYLPSVSAPVTREWAAKMIVNAIITADMVGYYGHYNGTTYEIQRATEDYTYGEKVLKLHISYAFAIGNNDIQISDSQSDIFVNEDGKSNTCRFTDTFGDFEVGEGDLDDLEAANIPSLNKVKMDMDVSLLGRLVKVISKTSSTNDFSQVYGVYAYDSAEKTTVAGAALAKNNEDKFYLTVNGTKTSYNYENESDMIIIADYVDMGVNAFAEYNEDGKTIKKLAVLPTDLNHEDMFVSFGAADNREITFVDYNEDGIFDAAFVNTATYGIVSDYNSGKTTFKVQEGTATGAINLDDELFSVTSSSDFERYHFNSDLKEDDVVRVTYDFTKGSEAYEVEKLDPVIGEFTEFKRGDNAFNKVFIDGTAYSQAAKGNVVDYEEFPLSDFEGHDDEAAYINYLSNDYELYTDGKYYVYGRSYEESFSALTANVCMVVAMSEESVGNNVDGDYWRIKVLMADGTVGTYNYRATSKQVRNGTAIYGGAVADLVNAGNHPVFEYSLRDNDIYFKNKFENNDHSTDYRVSAPRSYTQMINGGMDLINPQVPNNTSDFDNGSTAAIAFADNASTIKVDGKSIRLADDSVIFIYSDSDNYAVIKGSELAAGFDNENLGSYIYKETNGMFTLVMAAAEVEDYKAAKKTSNYGVVVDDPSTTYEDDETIVNIPVINMSGEAETLKVKSSELEYTIDTISKAHYLRNVLIAYDVMTDGYAEIRLITDDSEYYGLGTNDFDDLEAKVWYAASIKGYDDATVLLTLYAYDEDDGQWVEWSQDYLEYASDMSVWIVDVTSTNSKLDYAGNDYNDLENAEEALSIATDRELDHMAVNALFRVNSDGDITNIIVDKNGDRDIIGASYNTSDPNRHLAFGDLVTTAIFDYVDDNEDGVYQNENPAVDGDFITEDGDTFIEVTVFGAGYKGVDDNKLYVVDDETLLAEEVEDVDNIYTLGSVLYVLVEDEYIEVTAAGSLYKDEDGNYYKTSVTPVKVYELVGTDGLYTDGDDFFTITGNVISAALTELGTTGYYYTEDEVLFNGTSGEEVDENSTTHLYAVGTDTYILFSGDFIEVEEETTKTASDFENTASITGTIYTDETDYYSYYSDTWHKLVLAD